MSHLDFHWKVEYMCEKLKNGTWDCSPVFNATDPTQSREDQRSLWKYYWLYFTNWSFNIFAVSLTVDTVLVVLRYLEERKENHKVAEAEEAKG